MNSINRYLSFLQRNSGKGFLAAAVGLTVLGYSVAASAGTIESGFTTVTASLVTYLGYALVAVLAVLTVAIGIRFIIKWLKRLVAAT